MAVCTSLTSRSHLFNEYQIRCSDLNVWQTSNIAFSSSANITAAMIRWSATAQPIAAFRYRINGLYFEHGYHMYCSTIFKNFYMSHAVHDWDVPSSARVLFAEISIQDTVGRLPSPTFKTSSGPPRTIKESSASYPAWRNYYASGSNKTGLIVCIIS